MLSNSSGSEGREQPTQPSSSGQLSRQDRLLLVLRGFLQLLPRGIGSAIDVWYFGTVQERRARRMEASLQEVAAHLDRLIAAGAKTPSDEYYGSAEFAELVENCLRRIWVESQEAKLRALRGALVTVILDLPGYSFDKRNSFVKAFDAIETIHIHALQLLAAYTASDKAGLAVKEICERLHMKAPSDRDFLYSALDTLANREFIKSGPVPFTSDGAIDKPQQQFHATALGREFLEFVRSSADGAVSSQSGR